VRNVLEFVGSVAVYGVVQIELAHAPRVGGMGLPPLGRLVVPGRILLYEQPVPPWHVGGRFSLEETTRLERAGAIVETCPSGAFTSVVWPDCTLRDFMLFEVLLHEVGHHILQQHTGKRKARIARTRDHEAFANQFVDRCRAAWLESEQDLA
jgi:hypothetical protein